MDTCDVAIVGGGPAGSTCAWQLRQWGYDVVVWDKSLFPRDKTCAGWIVPQVIESLQLDVAEYAANHVWQPFTGFQVGLLDRPGMTIRFDRPVSYGIRRCEFDEYLLRRSGAILRLGEPVQSLRRVSQGWVINESLQSPLLIGAGGNLCPVSRWMRGEPGNRAPTVAAMEVEFSLAGLACADAIDGETPRLYFCDDLLGYGWCVRKQNFLNVGIGRVDSRDVPTFWRQLQTRLQQEKILPVSLPQPLHGHAYHVYDGRPEQCYDDGVILIGDAAGLADRRSGEGIRPAIESGLIAAEVIQAADRNYDRSKLAPYATCLKRRLGRSAWNNTPLQRQQQQSAWQSRLVNWLLNSRWFNRQILLKRWFLHAHQAAVVSKSRLSESVSHG